MAAVKIPTSADIYLEVNGVRVAVVQSYKVTATRSSKAIYAFGQEAPVATIRGQGQYRPPTRPSGTASTLCSSMISRWSCASRIATSSIPDASGARCRRARRSAEM